MVPLPGVGFPPALAHQTESWGTSVLGGWKSLSGHFLRGRKKKQRRSIEHFFSLHLCFIELDLTSKTICPVFSDHVFMVQLLLSYCPRWYLYIQMKEYRNNPGILKHLWCRRFSDDTKIQTQQDAIEKSTFHLEWATWFQSGLHCLLSSLFARSLPLI